MISDVLSEAVERIDDYLLDMDVYGGDLRDRIIKLRGEMVLLQRELDTPPASAQGSDK